VLNWAGWAANFLGWGEVGTATPTPTPTPDVGGGGRRRRQAITVTHKGREHQFRTEHDAERFIDSLRAKVVPKKQAKKVAKPVEMPAAELPKLELQAPPDMSHLRAKIDAHNARVAAEHQAAMVAWQRQMEIEADDEDVFTLLRMLDDA
jgi:hypothetical protein